MPELMPNVRVTKRVKTDQITLRGFPGGLNTLDSDIGMKPIYCVLLNNFYRTASGTQRVRYGSKWFADISDMLGLADSHIVDMEYFTARLVAFSDRGEAVTITNAGAKFKLWDAAIAAALPGAPAGWTSTDGATTTIDFVPFKSTLIVHNGVDKPLSISSSYSATYLDDAATGSNTFVPIGKYGCVVSDYHCVAGIPAALTSVYVSSKGTDGTFFGAPPPNDGIIIDVGAYAPQGAPEITGIAGFRNYLIVFFATQAVLIKLGTYDSAGDHVPEFPDTIPLFGLLGHRCFVPLDNDIVFGGRDGVATVRRNLESSNIDSARVSDRIEPSYREVIGQISEVSLSINAFMIKDKLEKNVTLYAPNGRAFTYSSNANPSYKSWSVWINPIWECGCVSHLGRVFLADGRRIYQQGNSVYANEQYYADKVNDRDFLWAASTIFNLGELVHDTASGRTYECIRSHLSVGPTIEDDITLFEASIDGPVWEEYLGIPINIDLETPWMTGSNPMQTQQARFISMNTKGKARYQVRAYVDNLYRNFEGTVTQNPAITMHFVGNDAVGFGNDSVPYGGGRRSNDPRLYRFPVRFKSIKIAITGELTEPLEIGTISLVYSRGGYSIA